MGQVDQGVRPLTPLQARIVAALEKMPGRRADWYDLGRMLWPMDKHPRAWNYSSNGGPPGWAMSLSRAVAQLQRAGLAHDDWKAAGVRSVRLVRPNVRAKPTKEAARHDRSEQT
jgi:hypothetical protein